MTNSRLHKKQRKWNMDLQLLKNCLFLHVYKTVFSKQNNLFRQGCEHPGAIETGPNWLFNFSKKKCKVRSEYSAGGFVVFLIDQPTRRGKTRHQNQPIQTNKKSELQFLKTLNCRQIYNIHVASIKSIKSLELLIKLTNLIR